MNLEPGTLGYISGDSAELGIADYNVRVSSPVEVLEMPSKQDKKVLVCIESIDGEGKVNALVNRSAVKPLPEGLRIARISKCFPFPFSKDRYRVQIWHTAKGGMWYSGIGRFCATEQEAKDWAAEKFANGIYFLD